MKRIFDVIWTTGVILIALLIVGSVIFRFVEIATLIEEFYTTFSWRAVAWEVFSGFVAGVWFKKTLVNAISENRKEKKKHEGTNEEKNGKNKK